MFGARPLLVALAEPALEEALSHLRVDLRTGPVGLGEHEFRLTLRTLNGVEQSAAWIVVVLQVRGLAQPTLEGVL